MADESRLFVSNRNDWRAWLEANHASAPEIWLIYPRKASGQPRIPYNDAVEEALCFGWIDSITRGIDDQRYSQRFTPRRSGSPLSQTNLERLRRLIERGAVLPNIVESVAGEIEAEFEWPQEIVSALKADEQAWANFQTYSEAYQRIRVAYVESRRNKPEEFAKRLANLVTKTAAGKQFGFGIEAYY